MTVLNNYSFSLKGTVLIEIVGLVLIIAFSIIFLRKKNVSRLVTLPVVLVAIICIYISYLGPDNYISRADTSVNWVWALQYVGYTPYFVHRSILASSFIKEPDGYEDGVEDLLGEIEQKAADKDLNEENKQKYPDLIFILNETYFDIDTLLDINTHNDVFKNYDRIKGIKGFTVSPQMGGGTNFSEYEYLTSNSTHLIPYVAPFEYLDMREANTVISFLKKRGYFTVGMHQFDATCYSRNVAYPAIGFDQIIWEEECQNLKYYGDRKDFATDQSVYENLIKYYESSDTSFPKCFFCLTIQNHGNWEQNGEEEDLVRIDEDFGEYTNQINEYLSCMKLSDEALGYLIDYFESVDRDVVVVLAGDHCPAFLPNIVENSEDEDVILKLKSTPFIIWSNHLKLDDTLLKYRRFSMNYLIPSALQVSGVPLSDYYKYLVNMRDEYPVLENGNGYYDNEYRLHTFTSEKELPKKIRSYYYLEYQNITASLKNKTFYE